MAEVLADLNLPEVFEPPLGASILPSSPSISSSVIANAWGVCSPILVLDPHPDLFLCVEVDGGTGGSIGVLPSPGPGHLRGLAFREMVNLSDGCHGSGQRPQGLFHIHQGGTVIRLESSWLGRNSCGGCGLFLVLCPLPFLGVDGGAFFFF